MKLLILAAVISCVLAAPRNAQRGLEPLIVGGVEADPNEFPFMVSMQYLTNSVYNHRCGASIINEGWVMTACHCVENANPTLTRMAAGLHSQTNFSGSEQYSQVDSFVFHPLYDTVTLENDICLVKLTTPYQLNDKVTSIELPELLQDTAAGTQTTVIGWGNLAASNPNRPDILRKVNVPVVSDETCRASYGPEDMFDSFICAGLIAGGMDACSGDSGGPLFTNNPLQQVGIVSWGQGCAQPRYYGVYTEVSYFVDWINTVTNN